MTKYRLGDVLTIIMDYRGKTPKKLGLDWTEDKNDIVALSAKNLKNGELINLDKSHYGNSALYNKWMKDGDISVGDILMTSEAPLGELFLVDKPIKAILSQRIFLLRPNNSIVLPWYLYFYMSSKNFQNRLNGHATGTTVIGIKQKELRNIEIELPSLSIQKSIVRKLVPISKKIEINKEINDNLLKLAKTKFWQIYLLPTDEFKMVPNGWEIASFSKIMTFSNGHNFKSNEMLKKYEPLTYKVFKQGNILIGGGLNELGTKSWIQKGKVTKLNKYVLKKWDLLMAMTDMKNKVAILGNTALMNCSNQYILNQRVGLIRSNNYNGTSPAYLFLLTNSKPFLHSIRSKAHSGVQVNLSSKEIRDTDVIIAPKNVNDGFNTFVKPIFDRIMVNQLENLTLNELKQTLLNRLF